MNMGKGGGDKMFFQTQVHSARAVITHRPTVLRREYILNCFGCLLLIFYVLFSSLVSFFTLCLKDTKGSDSSP
jgi:hypothetical protein